MKLQFTGQMSKVKQLADAMSLAISNNEYSEGEALPSINKISREYQVSRDTVFKAFNELKSQGVVDSAPTKGYYVSTAVNNILLLLDTYSPFKYELHESITKNLPQNCKIDLYFHQNNEELFTKIITNSIDRYNLYLVMNYRNDIYSEILDKLPAHKVMLLDFGKFEKDQFAYVCQGFDKTLYDCMLSGKELFDKYKKLIFIMPEGTEHPRSCIPYFEKFCIDNGFEYEYKERVTEDCIEKGCAYLIVNHRHLIDAIKYTKKKGYALGKDAGVVVFNDEPVYEILNSGITVISTDFHEMGEVAAEFIKTRKKIQTYIPTKLIDRGSL